MRSFIEGPDVANPDALHAIVYVSSATRALGPAELEHLLDCARERNAQEGVTGYLLYCEGNFMQYIEGPPEGLQRIYDVICADSKHKGLLVLLDEDIDAREFAGWGMAYSTVQYDEYRRLVAAPWKATAVDAAQGGPSLARSMLQEFWRTQGP